MKAAVAEYMKTVLSNVLKGFRVPVGDQFLTVYPNLNASVKDVKDKEGKVTVATAKMLTANKGKSRLGASVSIKFSQEFACNVSWQKIDEARVPRFPTRTSLMAAATALQMVVANWSLNPSETA